MPAYDDPPGVTAAFDRNLLARINRELAADFDPRQISGISFAGTMANAASRCICSLKPRNASACLCAGCTIDFGLLETIWTESSHKYNIGEVLDLARRTGFRCEAQWTDHEWPFAHSLFVAC